MLLEIMCSRSLQHNTCLSLFLYTVQKLACFHSCGILPQLGDFLKIIKRIGEINSLHSLSILLGILSGPADMCGFRFVSNFIYASFCYVDVLHQSAWPLSFIRNRIVISIYRSSRNVRAHARFCC